MPEVADYLQIRFWYPDYIEFCFESLKSCLNPQNYSHYGSF